MDINGNIFYPSLPLVFFRPIYLFFYLGLATLVALDGTWVFHFNTNSFRHDAGYTKGLIKQNGCIASVLCVMLFFLQFFSNHRQGRRFLSMT